MNRTRRKLSVSMALAPLAVSARAARAKERVEVWTGPSCACCRDWVKHLEANGFQVTLHDTGNSEARSRLRMPVRFGACHTAEIGWYAIEGHVPAREIKRLLLERPQAVGLSVPAMPRGSPGMDGRTFGGQRDPFDVLLIQRDGSATVFQSYS